MSVSGGPPPGSRDTATFLGALARPTFQTVLVGGLLLTVAVWLFAGYYFANRIRGLELEAAAVSRRYIAAQETVASTRRQLDRAALHLRDALLDPNPAPDRYRREVNGAFDATEDLLAAYVPVLDSQSERRHLDRLRKNIQELRQANDDLLAGDSRRWHSASGVFLLGEVTPKRDAAIGVSDDLQKLNRDGYVAQQAETARVHGAIQNRFWETLGVGVLSSLVIGLISAWQVGRLERRLRAQQQRDASNAADLQRLSARLVNAQEEERRSIARELHDEIGQVLTAIKMELGHVQRQLTSGGSATLDDARAITDRGLVAVRDLSHLLHPPELEELGLAAAVNSYVQTIRRRQDIRIDFAPPPLSGRLPCVLELAVYRTIQEALTNVVRHSHARTCQVAITKVPSSIVVTVSDDGVGFSPDTLAMRGADSGLGLVGIRERVLHLGGALRVESACGCGTTLTAEFPLQADVTTDLPTGAVEFATMSAD